MWTKEPICFKICCQLPKRFQKEPFTSGESFFFPRETCLVIEGGAKPACNQWHLLVSNPGGYNIYGATEITVQLNSHQVETTIKHLFPQTCNATLLIGSTLLIRNLKKNNNNNFTP